MLIKIKSWIEKVKYLMVPTLGEESVRPVSVIKHCIGVVKCRILYGSGIDDYFELRLFEKKHSVRKTYFTSKDARRFLFLVNGIENSLKFCDKIYMYQVLGRFLKREQLFCPPQSFNEFEEFIRRHGTVIYKKNNSYNGTGIERWSANGTDIRKLYEIARNESAILDEPVIQHPDIARLNPDSVNTVRIYTMKIKDTCHIIAAELRMGRAGQLIDNIEKGGLYAAVDLNTGAIPDAAYDLWRNKYTVHPDTGVEIAGFILPNWAEVLRFTEECAHACPLVAAEWDIAVRENDCVLIEANANVRNCEIQMGASHGRKKQFKDLEKLYFQSLS
ncbi:MAG: hypothetical protein IJJ67_08690 [Oscillospiraceae bacterium]|nr:hypothetical protein [Oscillospiraceae bacterium]